MTARAIAVAVLVMPLTGCVTSVAQQRAALEAAADCCTSMRDFRFARLAMTDEREVTLGAESPAYTFETGKSFFAAYRLPTWSAPYQIRSESQPSVARAGLLSPSALLLDGEFRITRRFNVAAAGAIRPEVLHIFVNESNRDEQYLVLFTAHATASGGVDRLVATPMTAQIGYVPVVLGARESRVAIPYSPTGVFALKVSPYQPQRAGEAAKPD